MFKCTLAAVCIAIVGLTVTAHAQTDHHIKCGTYQVAQNPKGTRPLQFALLEGFRDSLFSPSERFLIHYNAIASDTDSVATPAYAQRAAEEADSAYDFEVTSLGYTAPEFTTDTHYDIYITAMHSQGPGYYGATYILEGGDLPESPSGVERWRSYTAVDNSFQAPIYATHGNDALRITIFHEFFHIIQFSGYGHPPTDNPDYVYFQEMSSVWMEWLSSPNIKDYLTYLPSYLSSINTRLDKTPSGGYGAYLFFAYLSQRYSPHIIRSIWEAYRDRYSDPIACTDAVLRDSGSSFCEAYEDFGVELAKTGFHSQGKSLLRDANALPFDSLHVTKLAVNQPTPVIAVALSLQFYELLPTTRCIAVIARDTNRGLQTDDVLTFQNDGGYTLASTNASAYCDTEICLPLLASEVTSSPNPFVLYNEGADSVLITASNLSQPPVSIKLDLFTVNEFHIRHLEESRGVPLKESWNATWDGRDDNGHLVPSGEYLYTLHVDGALKVGKIVVVRK